MSNFNKPNPKWYKEIWSLDIKICLGLNTLKPKTTLLLILWSYQEQKESWI